MLNLYYSSSIQFLELTRIKYLEILVVLDCRGMKGTWVWGNSRQDSNGKSVLQVVKRTSLNSSAELFCLTRFVRLPLLKGVGKRLL